MNYQAVYDKIIVEKMDENAVNTTSSGIILQNANVSVFSKAKIVSIGEGDFHNGVRIKMDVKLGDVVLYNPNMSSPLYSNHDNKLFVISSRDLIAYERGE